MGANLIIKATIWRKWASPRCVADIRVSPKIGWYEWELWLIITLWFYASLLLWWPFCNASGSLLNPGHSTHKISHYEWGGLSLLSLWWFTNDEGYKKQRMNFKGSKPSLNTNASMQVISERLCYALFKPPSCHINRENVVYTPEALTTCARNIIILNGVYVNIYNRLISSMRRRVARLGDE